MGAKTGGKSGKIIKQNGKNKGQEKEEAPEDGPDLSVLRKPIEISVPGLHQVVKAFQTGTPELRHILSYECDIVYECKVCRNLFRSLANFISHKRVYCTELYSNTQHNIYKKNKRVDDSTIFVQPEPVRTTRLRESWATSDGTGDRKEVRESRTRNGQAEPAPFRITIKKDLTSIVEKLMQKNSTQTLTEVVGHVSTASDFYDGVSEELDVRRKESKQQTIHLEPMDNTSFGVFQTIIQTTSPGSELIKSQVEDLQRIMSETEAVLGPDGRVIENGTLHSSHPALTGDKRRRSKTVDAEYNGPPVTAPESEVELYCNLCKEHFPTFKTLNQHMKSLHMTFRTFYPCPCCKLPLSNSWSVYRHLLKVHRKTNEQIRKLREKVMKRSFRKEVLQSGAQKLSKSNATENPVCPSQPIYGNSYNQIIHNDVESDKQWFEHLEDDIDLQCCGGCGRRFERRAALLAHSHICLKRLTVKQSSVGAGRQVSQVEKPAAVGSALSQQAKTVSQSALSCVPSTVGPAQQTSPSLPNALNRSIQLNNVEHATPTKKIEIQVRRDYGKSSSVGTCRTRTPSISRSEDGAASVGKSDDGTTSGSSEAEATTPFVPNDYGITYAVERAGRKRCIPTAVDHNSSDNKGAKQIRRGVGRPPKHRPEPVIMNGVSRSKDLSISVHDFSSDESHNEGDKEVPESPGENKDLERSNASTVMPIDIGSDDEDDASTVYSAVVNAEPLMLLPGSDNEKKMAALSNVRKLQCLTCRKKYKSLGNLRRHVAMHIGWNRFRCIMCDFKCFSKCECIKHALSIHLDPWEKQKAMAMVQDMQMDAGGSIDDQSCDGHVDSGDSECASSEIGSPTTTPEKSPKHVLQNEICGETMMNSSESSSSCVAKIDLELSDDPNVIDDICNLDKSEIISYVPK